MELVKYDATKEHVFIVYSVALDGALMPHINLQGKPDYFESFQQAHNYIRICKEIDEDHGFKHDYFIAIKVVEE